MPDGRVFEVGPISAVEVLPAIGAPEGILGTRPVQSQSTPDPFSLADARSFHVDLEHGPALAADEPALEQGKRRG